MSPTKDIYLREKAASLVNLSAETAPVWTRTKFATASSIALTRQTREIAVKHSSSNLFYVTFHTFLVFYPGL